MSSNIEGLGIVLKPIVTYIGNITNLELEITKQKKKIQELNNQIISRDELLYSSNMIINTVNDEKMILISKINNYEKEILTIKKDYEELINKMNYYIYNINKLFYNIGIILINIIIIYLFITYML